MYQHGLAMYLDPTKRAHVPVAYPTEHDVKVKGTRTRSNTQVAVQNREFIEFTLDYIDLS